MVLDSKESLFKREILTVGQLTARVKTLLENGIGSIWLAGEISNLRRPGSGHYYMTLKDSGAQIRGVLFRTKQRYLGFEPEDGQEVLVRGRISVYEPRGEYQILIEFMEPRGAGALQLAFERLKEKLAAEGLFDEKLKKKLPYLPGRVAVITSPTGAAIRDFVRVARRRYENVAISIYPVRVQGTEAAGEIVEALETLNRTGGFEVIVLTRGGGSLEDLWPFNEEIVARAVAASGIPVVSAVGHEVDFTISDFVSDLRAPTPSAAAELVFREKKELQNYFYGIRRRLWAAAGSRIRWHSERLAHLQTRLGAPQRLLSNPRQRLDDLTEGLVQATASRIEFLGRRLETARARLAPANPRTRLKSDRAHLSMLERSLVRSGRNVVAEARSRLSGSAARLSALSPLSVLGRGYALVRKGPDGPPLRSSRDTAVGEKLNVLLAQGALAVSVEEVEE